MFDILHRKPTVTSSVIFVTIANRYIIAIREKRDVLRDIVILLFFCGNGIFLRLTW